MGAIVVTADQDGASEVLGGDVRRLSPGNACELDLDAKVVGKHMACPPFVGGDEAQSQRASTNAPLGISAPWPPDWFTDGVSVA